MRTTCSCFFLLAMLAGAATMAQADQQNVAATILHLDSAFWKSYNTCDTGQFRKYFTDDVEFYHDKGGITNGAQELTESFSKNLCSNKDYRLRREPVAETVEVYPMQNGNKIYGAVISGEHLFYITDHDKPEYLDGRARFTDLWLLKDGAWKMARILSYNHHPGETAINEQQAAIPPNDLDRLTGTYRSPQFGTVTLTRDNDVLLLKTGDKILKLYPRSETMFFTKDRDLTFEFENNARGKPVKIIVKEHGARVDELILEK